MDERCIFDEGERSEYTLLPLYCTRNLVIWEAYLIENLFLIGKKIMLLLIYAYFFPIIYCKS